MNRDKLKLLFYFLIAYVDVLRVRDLVEQDGALHLGKRRIALGNTQPIEVKLAHVIRLHSLRCERTQAAVKSRVHLLLHQRFGYGKLEALDERLQKRVFGGVLKLAALLRTRFFAQSRGEGIDGLVVAQFFRELVIEFRQDLLLDRLDFNLIRDRLSRQTLLAEILRIGNFKFEFLSRLRSAQRVVERGKRIASTDLH